MSIKIKGFECLQPDGEEARVLSVDFLVQDDAAAIKLLGDLRALLAGTGIAVNPESPTTATLPPAVVEPPKTTPKRASTKPAAVPAPTAAPAPAVAPAPAAGQVVETVTPPLPAASAAPAPLAAVPPAPKAAVQRQPESVAAAAPAPAGAEVVTGPVPGIPLEPPPELVNVPSFRDVLTYLLQHGVTTHAGLLAACAQYQSKIPIVARMMAPQADPEAEIGPRIARALEVMAKPKVA